jgi:hypothetical protein
MSHEGTVAALQASVYDILVKLRGYFCNRCLQAAYAKPAILIYLGWPIRSIERLMSRTLTRLNFSSNKESGAFFMVRQLLIALPACQLLCNLGHLLLPPKA